MAAQLIDYLRSRKPKSFTSHPFYSKEGDFLTYFFDGSDHYAERIDDHLTVYKSKSSQECTGLKLKGIRHLFEAVGDYFCEVHGDDGDLMLSLLVSAGMILTKSDEALPLYKRAVERTKSVSVEKGQFEFAQ